MQSNIFYNLGKALYSIRWLVILLWIVSLLACIPFLPNIISPFKTTGFTDENSKSVIAENYLKHKLGYISNRFIIIYSSKTLLATDPLFLNKINDSLDDLKDFSRKHYIFLPKENKKQIAKGNHTAYVVVMLKGAQPIDEHLLQQFKDAIKTPRNMTVQIGGETVFVDAVNKQTQTDLYRADFIATPMALVTMLFVFGSVIAAVIPILLGGGSALLILTILYFVGHMCELSIFTLNIALLLGLCLSLDYCLFVISRFRDELRSERERPIEEAIAVTQATAGKAVFFSGLAVFASLSGLLLFPINILFSVAIGGMIAVFVAVLTAILVLPALLAMLGTRINLLSIRLFRKKSDQPSHIWRWVAEKVVRRPGFFFVSILTVLLMLGYPLVYVKLGVSDFRILPEHSKSRSFFDTYATKYNKNELEPINILAKSREESILSSKNISRLYNLTHKIKAIDGVAEVNSIVTLKPDLTKTQYIALYQTPIKNLSSPLKATLATTTGKNFSVISVVSKYSANSGQTQTLIQDLKKLKAPKGMTLTLTGTLVNKADVLQSIKTNLPWAILWIMVFTYLILLFLLRSLFLPFKAILMNLLSLSACYGALVLVFQMGYLHNLLHFEPQGMLDISLLVIIFCALFGFSMDYEVFLLSRIKEGYELTHDNEKSIIFGIEKSSSIITSAAFIVIFLCASFLVAEVLMVKAFGLGIAIAIFVDAFLIRTFLVPATMTLIKSWNWYLPRWLERLLPPP